MRLLDRDAELGAPHLFNSMGRMTRHGTRVAAFCQLIDMPVRERDDPVDF